MTGTGEMGWPLAELQTRFQDYVLRNAEEYPASVTGPTGVAVYTEAYLLRFIEALTTDYPVLHQLLGDSEFDKLVRGYALAHPSRHFSIRWFGRELPDFLRHTYRLAAESYLAELALWEWCLGESFDAADSPAVGAEFLQQIPAAHWPLLRLDRRLEQRFAAVGIWRALSSGGSVPKVPEAGSPKPWLIWRHDLEVLYRPLDPAEARAMDVLRGNANLSDAAEVLIAAGIDQESAPLKLAGWLASWVAQGLIAGARIQEPGITGDQNDGGSA